MARSTVTLTTSFQKLSDKKCIISIKKTNTRAITFNDADSDTNALIVSHTHQAQMFEQGETKSTYAKCGLEGEITVLVVEEG